MTALRPLLVALTLILLPKVASAQRQPHIDAAIIGQVAGDFYVQVLGRTFGPRANVLLVFMENGLYSDGSTAFHLDAESNGRFDSGAFLKKTAACYVDVQAIETASNLASNIVHIDKPSCTPAALAVELLQPAGSGPGVFITGTNFTPSSLISVGISFNGSGIGGGELTADGNGFFFDSVLSVGREHCGRLLNISAFDWDTWVTVEAVLQTNPC